MEDSDDSYNYIVVYPGNAGEYNGMLIGVFELLADARVICPLQSGPKVNLDWTLKETEHGQEART